MMEALGTLIRKWAQPSWSMEVISHPCGICNKCHVMLYSYEKNASKNLYEESCWQNFHLEEISVPHGQLAANCNCQICAARKNNVVCHKGFNNVKKLKKQIETRNVDGQFSEEPNPKPCPICFQQKTVCGIPHTCSPASRKANLAALVIQEEGRGSEQIVSKVLKKLSERKGTKNGDELQLRQLKGGNNLTVHIRKINEK